MAIHSSQKKGTVAEMKLGETSAHNKEVLGLPQTGANHCRLLCQVNMSQLWEHNNKHDKPELQTMGHVKLLQ